MAKKITTKTTEQTEVEGAPETLDPPQPLLSEMTTEEGELSAALASMGPDVSLVKINKIVDGRRKWCGSVEPLALIENGEEFISTRWGGGRYYLLGFINGNYVSGSAKTIEIYEAPEKPGQNQTQNQNQSQNYELLLREEIQRQNTLIMKLIENQRVQSPIPGPTLTEIVGALGSMRSLVPSPPDLATMLPGLVGLIRMAKETVTPDSGGGFTGIIESAIKAVPMIMGGIAAMKTSPSAPSAPAQDNGALTQDQAERETLLNVIGRLKEEFQSGMSPDDVVYWISNHMQQPSYRSMATILLNRQFETLFPVDKDLEKEPLRSWFLKIYTELRKVFIDGDPDQKPDAASGRVGSETDVE